MLIKTDRWLRGDDIPASEITPQPDRKSVV